MEDTQKNTTHQGQDSNLTDEEFDFSELQGLTCGPEGCSLPIDYYDRITKNQETQDDNN